MKKIITRPFRQWIYLSVVLLVTVFFIGCSGQKSYEGYKVLDSKFVSEINAECVYLEHIQSGARVFKIMADDPNKLFAIAFKTVPNSDCGTPHIIEHSVLNGSKNFPVKSPFDVLLQGSLNTFLNAMTGADLTVYPVASMNDKDYFNLMHVYLDAVYNPLIYSDPRIFKQEGWHYELTGDDDPLIYKGVVFNEMKGAFSSPNRELGYQVNKNLYPDISYGFSSGGYPTAIPDLTYEDFLEFHATHYHPSNSYILLYGDADLAEELEFIDTKYLSEYERSDKVVEIKEQAPFDEVKRVVSGYPVLEGTDLENNTFLQLSIVTGYSTEYDKNMALDVISDVIANQESAPLRLALQEAGIGSDVSAYIDDNKQNAFHIIVRNANEDQMDSFFDITMATLAEVVENGIDKEAIEGTLNRMEFNLREGNSAQKGLTYGMQLLHGWFFADDPYIGLQYEEPLAEVKRSLTENYMENIISEVLIGNNHAVLVALKPVPGLQAEIDKKVATKLREKKKSLDQEAKAMLIKETEELIEYQKRADTPEALATIPLLSLDDITKEAVWYEATGKEIDGIKTIHLDEFTSNILYSKLLFDLRVLTQEQIQYAGLLSNLFGKFDTENYTYGELDNQLNIHTGGFNSSISVFTPDMSDENYIPLFTIQSKAVTDKGDKLFELTEEILLRSNYDDTDRLKELITRHLARVDSRVKNSGINYAVTRLFSYYSNTGAFNEQLDGFDYYWFLADLAENFDTNAEEIIAGLKDVSTLLFTRSNLAANITCSDDNYKNYSAGLSEFAAKLPEGSVEFKEWNLVPEKKNEGFMTTSKVQYVLKGANYKDLGYDWSGKISVLSQILSTDWLQNQIRVIGGAYGGFSSFGVSGNMFFGSYRDPNLSESLENYDATPSYLESFDADETAMTRYIIGTIATLDDPETPSMKGNTALRRYYNGITKEFIQSQRDDILSTTASDIVGMKEMVDALMSQDVYCVYGNKDKIEKEKDLFMTITNPVR